MIFSDILFLFVLVMGFHSLLFIHGYLQGHLYSKIKKAPLYHIFFLPGVFLHEISHLLMCLIMRKEIVSAKLYKFDHSTGQLGNVVFMTTNTYHSWIPNMLIGMAPLLTSMAVFTLLLGHLPILEDSYYDGILGQCETALYMLITGEIQWWVVFLVLSVSYSATPSSADLRISAKGLGLIYLIVFIFWLLGSKSIVSNATVFLEFAILRLIAVLIPSYLLIGLLSIITITIKKAVKLRLARYKQL